MKTRKYLSVFAAWIFFLCGFVANAPAFASEISSEFKIKRIELYFENKRAEITIPKNTPGLKAFAEINYNGSGLIEGHWEVDGRTLSHVSRHLTSGRPVKLQNPKIPELPTFDPGSHILRFVITRPSSTIPMPSIVYYVTADESPERPFSITLISPDHQVVFEYTSQQFKWRKFRKNNLFLIQYFDKANAKAVFSAYTKKGHYILTKGSLKKHFSPDGNYAWKVTGYDAQNRIAGESQMRDFRFQK